MFGHKELSKKIVELSDRLEVAEIREEARRWREEIQNNSRKTKEEIDLLNADSKDVLDAMSKRIKVLEEDNLNLKNLLKYKEVSTVSQDASGKEKKVTKVSVDLKEGKTSGEKQGKSRRNISEGYSSSGYFIPFS